MADPVSRPLPGAGAVVAGYRLDEVLGHGGMGIVYRAWHVVLERPAAIKLIQPALAAIEGFQERFRRESRAAAALEHPHVVPIFDAGEQDGLLYIAMRYVPGTDLGREIAERGPLEPARAVRIVAQVASALDAAHAAGLVHRDVKPANVLLAAASGADHAYLTDFGLTKRSASVGGLTATGQVVGTVDFIAPEQLRGEAVDGRADIYALGCLIFQTLTGRVPFPRDNELATVWAHINEPPPAVTRFAPHLPPAIDQVVALGLAKDPDERPESAGELAARARAALERGTATGAAVAVAPTEVPSTPQPRPVRRAGAWRVPPWLAPACGLIAVAVYFLAYLVVPSDTPSSDAPVETARLSIHAHQGSLTAGFAIQTVAAVVFAGFVAALPPVLADSRGRLDGRGLIALATVVGFAVLALVDSIMDLLLVQHSMAVSDRSLFNFLWDATGLVNECLLLLMGFFVAIVATVLLRNPWLPAALSWSGVAVGSVVAVVGLVLVVVPWSGSLIDNLGNLLFQLAAMWVLVLSVILIGRAASSGRA